MIYKYKINYKSIGGSSSTSTTSSSSTSSNSTTLENKIKYIDNIIDNLGYEEGNNRIFYITEYTPLSGEIYDYVQKIKNNWEKSKNLNPNERIIELLNLLEKKSLKIENFNIFYTKLIRIAVRDWFDDQNIYGPISNWDTSYVTSMSYLFANRENFDEDISRWNVSNVTDMSYMFKDAKKFNGDISSWNTSNVRFMQRMFEGAESFNQNINTKSIENSDGEISYTAWDVSNVEFMENMFKGATSFNGIVSGWTLNPLANAFETDLNIILYLRTLTGKTKTIIINPFYTVAHLKQELRNELSIGNNRVLNILIEIPLEERRNLTSEAYLQMARLQDQRELRSYDIKNNDILTYFITREEN